MRVLIGYDGSPGSELMMEHLCRRRAGLPPFAEVLIVAVAKMRLPASALTADSMLLPPTAERPRAVKVMERRAVADTVRHLRDVVRVAAARVRAACPGWHVAVRVRTGNSAIELVEQAIAWKADMILVGSRGGSCWQRWTLGSVAREVLHEAPCTVRIVRGRLGTAGAPMSLVIGLDGSPGSQAAVDSVAARTWPRGSCARLVIAIDTPLLSVFGAPSLSVATMVNARDEQPDSILVMAHRAADVLRATGLLAQVVVRRGEAARVLTDEAKHWGADCVIVGAAGRTGLARVLLGSVSSAVAMQAPVTVEVVRPAGRSAAGSPERQRTQATGAPFRAPVGYGSTVMPTNRLKDFLDQQHVPYESIDHEPEYTAQRIAEETHTPGRLMAKTVLVKVDGKLAMVVVPAPSRIDLVRLRRELGARRIELAKEAEFEQVFPDSEPGAEPPFGNLYHVPVFIASSLADNAQIVFNAGSHTEAIRMRYPDFERLVKPKIVSFWVAPTAAPVGHN